MIDAFSSHHWRHLAPIVDELRARGHEVRGWSRGNGTDQAPILRGADRNRARFVLVASWDDAQLFSDKRVVYVEHGAGQSYVGCDGHGYSGAGCLDHVVLFLAPGEPTATRWRRRYPTTRAVPVGCPALDVHSSRGKDALGTPPLDDALPHPRGRVVAFTQHWPCSICPETRPALPHYHGSLAAVCAVLGDFGARAVGHSHPKGYGEGRRLWRALGIPHETDPDVILRTASVLVADNSSIMYEAAALDVPVLALNAPWYRREVHHGLRFWSHVPGHQVDDPDQLADDVVATLAGVGYTAEHATVLRRRAAAHVYAAVDGKASARAADEIERLL